MVLSASLPMRARRRLFQDSYWRVEEARRVLAGGGQELLKFVESERIGSELCARTVNGAVRSSLVILNMTFRPRHKTSPIFLNRWGARRDAALSD